MKKSTKYAIAGFLIGVTGCVVIATQSGIIAAGVFLMIFGNNLDRRYWALRGVGR